MDAMNTNNRGAVIVSIDPATWAAREIEDGVIDLMRLASRASTVNEALRLFHTMKTLREELDQAINKALERADSLC